jgi:hypothetical protein
MLQRLPALLCALAALCAGYVGVQSLVVLQRHYSWHEMDWNDDGRTTLAEFFASARIDRWTVVRGGSRCSQYYSTHALTAVKTVCPTGSVAAISKSAANGG